MLFCSQLIAISRKFELGLLERSIKAAALQACFRLLLHNTDLSRMAHVVMSWKWWGVYTCILVTYQRFLYIATWFNYYTILSFHLTFCDFSPNLDGSGSGIQTHTQLFWVPFILKPSVCLPFFYVVSFNLAILAVYFVSPICSGSWSIRLDSSFVWICVFACGLLVFISKLWEVQISQCMNSKTHRYKSRCLWLKTLSGIRKFQ